MELNDSCMYYTISDFNSKISSTGKSFSVLHVNCRSIRKKSDSITIFLQSLSIDFDVITFSETWIMDKADAPYFPGYRFELICRQQKKGGGIAIYFKDTLKYELIENFSLISEDIEILTMRFGKVTVNLVYRPPHGHKAKFLQFLDKTLASVTLCNTPYVIIGDINIDMRSGDPYSQEFQTVLSAYGFTNHITLPTRISNQSATVIDICATNVSPDSVISGIISYELSDHLPVFCVIPLAPDQSKVQTHTRLRRKKNAETQELFYKLVEKNDWSSVYNQTDPDAAYDTFLAFLRESFNAAFPLQRLSHRTIKSCRKPWITASLYERIKSKNKLFHDFVRSREPTAFLKYKKYRNTLTSDLKKAKKDYYQMTFERIYDNQRKIWEVVNALTGKYRSGRCIEELTVNGEPLAGKRLADAFNAHFINAGSYERPDVSTDNALTDGPSVPQSIFMRPTDSVEIENLIRKLKRNVASGIDEIGPAELKVVSPLICEVLSYIVNLTLTTGIFPKQLKLAKVTAIFKGGEINNLSNYRPISVLPTLSKIFEGVIHERLTSFFDKHQIIATNQYGFQKHRSTEQALIHIKEKIIVNMESRKYTLGLFLDIQKAFDSIHFDLLLKKLSSCGIRGIALDIVENYLHDRHQIVGINETTSAEMKLKQGVPQGSLLGPLLFLVYINDIVNIPGSSDIIMYADDTNIFFSSNSLTFLETEVNEYLAHLSNWLQQNKLRLNASKTTYIIFRPINKPLIEAVNIKYEGHTIARVKEQKFLGVWFQEELNWSAHVKHLVTALARTVGCLYKISHLVPLWLKRNMYYSLFYSKLTYGILVWGTTTQKNYNQLVVLQKKILRCFENFHGKFRDLPTSPLFVKHSILKADQLYYFRLVQMIHKNKLYVDADAEKRHYCVRRPMRRIPKIRTNYGKQSATYQVPHVLNMLADNLNFNTSPTVFKTGTKLMFIEKKVRYDNH